MTDSARTISFEVDDTFVRQVAAEGFGMRLTGTSPSSVLALGLCAALAVVAVVRDSGLIWVLVFAIPAVVGFAGIGGLTMIRRRLRRGIANQYDQLPPPRRITVDLSDDGLRFANAVETQDVPWSELAEVVQGDSVWYLKLRSGLGIPIPAKAISEAARARLIAETKRDRSSEVPQATEE